MNKPSLDVLMDKIDSKYTLVVAAAKRARAITEEEAGVVDSKSRKSVSIALNEIASDLITYENTKIGIK